MLFTFLVTAVQEENKFLIPCLTLSHSTHLVNISSQCSICHNPPPVYSAIIYGGINTNNAGSYINSEILRDDIYVECLK